MPRIQQNPGGETCPNFASLPFEAVRNALSAAGENSPDEVIRVLTAAWTQDHETRKTAWAAQELEDQKAREEAEKVAEEEERTRRETQQMEEETERKEAEKKKPKLNDFDEGRMVRHPCSLIIMLP